MTVLNHPIRDLNVSLRRAHQAFLAIAALLALLLVCVPLALRLSPIVVLDQGSFARTSKAQPVQLTVSRLEGFTRSYLTSRWEWTPENFDAKQAELQNFLDPKVMAKLKDSIQGLQSLVKAQHARSYYVLEGWGFSNEDGKIEAHFDRVIRIGNAAVATPFVLHLVFQEAAVSESNPYGLKIVSLEELELREGNGQ